MRIAIQISKCIRSSTNYLIVERCDFVPDDDIKFKMKVYVQIRNCVNRPSGFDHHAHRKIDDDISFASGQTPVACGKKKFRPRRCVKSNKIEVAA